MRRPSFVSRVAGGLPALARLGRVGWALSAWLMLAAAPVPALDIAAGGEVQVNGEPARLADVVVPDAVTIEQPAESFAVGPRGHDRWLRPIVDLTGGDGSSLAAELVRNGQALVSPDAEPGDLAALQALEGEARTAARGLWGTPRWRVQAADRVRGQTGDLVLVEGRVREAAWAGDWLYLNFGSDRQTDFTARADRATVRDLARSGINSEGLARRNLRLRGWLMQVGGPMIEITGPAQVELLP